MGLYRALQYSYGGGGGGGGGGGKSENFGRVPLEFT